MNPDDSNWATPITLAAVSRAAAEWRHYRDSIYWDETEPLGILIKKFIPLFTEGLRDIRHVEDFDDETITLIVMLGIEESGSHTFDELENALGRSPPGGTPK